MNDSYFYVFSSLLSPQHVSVLGSAIWLLLWLANEVQYQERNLRDDAKTFTCDWSQDQAASQLGVSRETINRWHALLASKDYVVSTRGRYGLQTQLLNWQTIKQYLARRQNVQARCPPDVTAGSHLDSGVTSDVTQDAVPSIVVVMHRKAEEEDAAGKRDVTDRPHLETWREALQALSWRMDREVFEYLFTGSTLELNHHRAMIHARNSFVCDVLAARWRDQIAAVLAEVLGRPVEVDFAPTDRSAEYQNS